MHAVLIGYLRTELRPRASEKIPLIEEVSTHALLQRVLYAQSVHFTVYYPPENVTHTLACTENERASSFLRCERMRN